MPVLQTIDLCKNYGKGETKVEALKNVSISINQGEFAAVIGPSGSGKSTLLHMLGGVDRPSSGKVFVDGVDLYTLNENDLALFRRRKVGFVFQFYNLIPVLTALENISLPLLLDNKKIEQEYLDELLSLLDLHDRSHHLPSELSGGQQQRVAIGRALAYKPAIILADEPTGNLDRKNSSEIIKLLRFSVQKYQQTLVVITHDQGIASLADRVIAIEDGAVVSNEVTK